MKKFKILYDIRYYGEFVKYQNYIGFQMEVYHSPLSKKITVREHFIDKPPLKYNCYIIIDTKFKFHHKVRVCDYYSKKYNSTFQVTKFFEPNKRWGGFNRAYDLDLDEMEKEYQKEMRYGKLTRIIK